MGPAIRWSLTGEAIGFVVAFFHLSGTETVLWATVATVVTAILGSVNQ